MVLGNKAIKIATLDMVANIGDVRQPCDFKLKTQHRQRLPDRQAFTCGEVVKTSDDRR
jgi:hypothetical protein